jgi:hypothetical protein
MRTVSYTVFALLLLNTAVQTVELFYMPPYNGQTYFGLSGRTPGIFSHAHSCASFICLSYIIVNEFADNRIIKISGRILAVFGVILAMSSTGVITLLAAMYIQMIRKRKNYLILIILVPVIMFAVYEFADVLTNRGAGSSALSMNTRKEYFINGLYSANILSSTFGHATNTTSMLLDDYISADAFYAAFLINLGILPFIFMVFFILCTGFIAVIKRKFMLMNIVILYSLFSFSIMITEVFPTNLFLALFIAYLIYHENEENYLLNNAVITG